MKFSDSSGLFSEKDEKQFQDLIASKFTDFANDAGLKVSDDTVESNRQLVVLVMAQSKDGMAALRIGMDISELVEITRGDKKYRVAAATKGIPGTVMLIPSEKVMEAIQITLTQQLRDLKARIDEANK